MPENNTGSEAECVVAIHQPNFLPWCGYFTKAKHCDIFVFLDDAQMSKGSYVSRVKIDMNGQARWLSLPNRFSFGDPIYTVEIAQNPEKRTRSIVNTLKAAYGRTPFFASVMDALEQPLHAGAQGLSQLNIALLEQLFSYMELQPNCFLSSALGINAHSDDRLVEIVKAVGGTTYLSGRGGTNYQDPGKFKDAGIELKVREYIPVPYPQGRSEFLPGLSILDSLFHLGPAAARELLVYQD